MGSMESCKITNQLTNENYTFMKYILITIIVLNSFFSFSQVLQNANFDIIDKKIEITYEISDVLEGQNFDISLWYSIDNSVFKQITTSLEGDVNKISAEKDDLISDLRIIWNPLADNIEIDGSLQFEIRANIIGDFKNYREKIDNITFEMIAITGGTFTKGSETGDENESPAHSVTVSGYYICNTEVTCEQFICFLNSEKVNLDGTKNGVKYINIELATCPIKYENKKFEFKPSNYCTTSLSPVITVTWYGAEAYCKWLSSKTGKKFRLPTEAEWEFAAKAKNPNSIWSGVNAKKEIKKHIWFSSTAKGKTATTGSKLSNTFGLYDMSGNVSEWCLDWYDVYQNNSQTNPKGPRSGSAKVYKGGSFLDNITNCKISTRNSLSPEQSSVYTGFRVCREQ